MISVHESSRKTHVEIFPGRNIIIPFEMFVNVSNSEKNISVIIWVNPVNLYEYIGARTASVREYIRTRKDAV